MKLEEKTFLNVIDNLFAGWDGWIRTIVCWYQKPVPYRLATSQFRKLVTSTISHNMICRQVGSV